MLTTLRLFIFASFTYYAIISERNLVAAFVSPDHEVRAKSVTQPANNDVEINRKNLE